MVKTLACIVTSVLSLGSFAYGSESQADRAPRTQA
ncbi:MAG: hypothetical protein RL011_266, partial [Pseudomonadota bacterium]